MPTPARKLATQRIYCAPQRAVGEGRLLFTLAFRNRQPGVVALSLILYLPLGFSVSGYSHNKLFARNSSFFSWNALTVPSSSGVGGPRGRQVPHAAAAVAAEAP